MSDEQEGQELVHLAMGLRSFSDEPRCPKCGTGYVKTAWHQFPIFQAEPAPYPCEQWILAELLTGDVGEHLCRWCQSCGYGWPEKTEDS